MNIVSNTSLILCTCTIACVVIKMLLPEGSTRKTMNIIITAFLIIAMVVPIKNLFAVADELSVSTPDEAKITRDYNNKVLSFTKENLEKSLISILNQNNIPVTDVDVYLRTDRENGILIDYIYIYIIEDNKSHISKIISLVEENYNITPEIILS